MATNNHIKHFHPPLLLIKTPRTIVLSLSATIQPIQSSVLPPYTNPLRILLMQSNGRPDPSAAQHSSLTSLSCTHGCGPLEQKHIYHVHKEKQPRSSHHHHHQINYEIHPSFDSQSHHLNSPTGPEFTSFFPTFIAPSYHHSILFSSSYPFSAALLSCSEVSPPWLVGVQSEGHATNTLVIDPTRPWPLLVSVLFCLHQHHHLPSGRWSSSSVSGCNLNYFLRMLWRLGI